MGTTGLSLATGVAAMRVRQRLTAVLTVLRLLFAMVMLPVVAIAETLPLEDFVKEGDYLDMTLSPDGKHILARVRAAQRVALIFLDSQTGKVVGGVQPNKDDIIHSPMWVDKHRVVYQFSQQFPYNEAPVSTGELFAVNIDNSRWEALYGFRVSDERTGTRLYNRKNTRASVEVLSTLPKDKTHILIIEYPWSRDGNDWYDDRERDPIISRLNVYSGKKRKLEVLPHGRSYVLATEDGVIHFMGWTDQSNVAHTAYRENNQAPWKSLDAVFDIDSQTLPLSINRDGTKVYLAGRVGDEGIYTLFELSLVSGELSVVFEGNTTDLEHWKLDIDTREPAIAYSYPGNPQYHYSKGPSKTVELHQSLAQTFAAQEVHITSSSDDGTLHLIHVSSSVNPGEYYIFDSETQGAHFVWANRSWIDPRKMQAKQPFSTTARDGVELNGYLTMPANQPGVKPPLVVLLHGGPRARDFPDFDSEVQLLADRGFAVLQVNFRGSDGYGLTFIEKGNRQWGHAMINDVVDATRWAIDQDRVDPDKLCVYGASYGGYAALMAAVLAPALYQCAVGYVGVYDLSTMYSESDIPDSWGGFAYLYEALGDDMAELRAYSPVNHADKIEAAVMLIHGDKDRRVPVVNAEAMEKQLKKAGKQVEVLRYAQGGHGVQDIQNQQAIYQGLIDFLNEHIPPASQPHTRRPDTDVNISLKSK